MKIKIDIEIKPEAWSLRPRIPRRETDREELSRKWKEAVKAFSFKEGESV